MQWRPTIDDVVEDAIYKAFGQVIAENDDGHAADEKIVATTD